MGARVRIVRRRSFWSSIKSLFACIAGCCGTMCQSCSDCCTNCQDSCVYREPLHKEQGYERGPVAY